MTCPFKVGDRVHELAAQTYAWGWHKGEDEFRLDESKPDATVTALTARGFAYRYDTPVQHGRPIWGTQTEGEVYEGGFQFWRKVDEPPPPWPAWMI